jgi:1,4-alpha-glucan branching enzyme
MQRWVRDLNKIYRDHASLHELDFSPDGFEWIDANDSANCVLSFLRKSRTARSEVVVVCNCTTLPRMNYRVGVPHGGRWREVLNSDASEYGGSGMGNLGGVEATAKTYHGREHSLVLTLPPLGVIMLQADA